jgi:polar amino acid transport system substrate-binding protein
LKIRLKAICLYFLLIFSASILYGQEANSTSDSTKELTTFEQIEKMRIGILSSSANRELLLNKAPKADNFVFLNTSVDGIAAVKSNKIDCYIDDEPVLRLFVNRNTGLKIAPLVIESFDFGIALKKNNPLTPKITKVINDFRDKGVLDELKNLWLGKDESKKTIDSIPVQNWEGKNGVIRFYNSADAEPLCYFGNNQTLIGYDIHLIYLVAKELDMKVIPTVSQFDSLIPALESGKADIVISCLTITEERQRTVDMIPYYHSSVRALVRDENNISNQSFIESLKESFHKTFIVENRWLMILNGLVVTVVISIGAGSLGFVFGFLLVIIHRKNNKYLSWLIKTFVTVINGIPSVVLLMLLYYVVLGSVDISPIIVSVIAFTVTFGATCYGLIGNGILAVNIGQEEAAKALGYNEFQSFYKIIFPQATRQFLPLMKGEFISMVKMTSIVGYIACIDLTKASDIIRSRTMEAFFPLISTAIIYFVIANLMTLVLNKFEISLDPQQRERKIVGVKELKIEN